MASLHGLAEEASNITSSTTGADYNDDYDHEDDESIPSLLVFELQEFIRPTSNEIAIFGADDREKAGCGRDVSISATVSQSVCTLVAEEQTPSSSYHDFNTDNLIPSVTHCMKITKDTGYYIYIGS